MYQLKQNGYIDNIVFSVYMSMKQGNTTHVKFGGWDSEGVDNQTFPDGPVFLKTKDNSTWALEMDSVRIGGNPIELQQTRFALIELAYPYIYMPASDF